MAKALITAAVFIIIGHVSANVDDGLFSRIACPVEYDPKDGEYK